MKRAGAVLGISALLALALAAVWNRGTPSPSAAPTVESAEFTGEELEKILQHSPLGPPPADPSNAVADNEDAARLGQKIFFDARFSKDAKVSCSSCHLPSRGFGDGKALPDQFSVDRNVPTLWNSAYNRWFFWDGRSDTLWSQALKPLENPKEHGGTRLQFCHLIREDAALKVLYERIFGAFPDLSDPKRFPPAGSPLSHPAGGPLQKAWLSMLPPDQKLVDRVFSNLGKAIAAYERRLQSRNSPFDVFVEGLRQNQASKLAALSPRAKKGLKLFVGRANCRICHSGPNFSDGEFHNIGIPPSRGELSADRYSAVEQVKNDPFCSKSSFSDDSAWGERKLDYLWVHQDLWGQIKTPGLRNIAKTAPYMHQGQFKTLKEVVRFYSTLEGMVQAGHHERTLLLPLQLTGEEVASLIAFLESLTDEQIDPALLKPLP